MVDQDDDEESKEHASSNEGDVAQKFTFTLAEPLPKVNETSGSTEVTPTKQSADMQDRID